MVVASVTHPEINSLFSSDAAVEGSLRYTKLEQNPSVSYIYKYVLAVTNDQQAQQSSSGILANAQNILITGGTFIVSLIFEVDVSDFSILILWTECSLC